MYKSVLSVYKRHIFENCAPIQKTESTDLQLTISLLSWPLGDSVENYANKSDKSES